MEWRIKIAFLSGFMHIVVEKQFHHISNLISNLIIMKYENSPIDKSIDKALGYKENSKQDKKMDKALMKGLKTKMVKRKSKKVLKSHSELVANLGQSMKKLAH